MSTCFFGPEVPIARFDQFTHSIFDKLTTQQLGYRWRETEVDILKDKADFRSLSPSEQHIFTSNLKRQIILDTRQGRAPARALLSLASLPEVENWIVEWTESETVHSRSYTHIIRNIYSSPSEVFDVILDIPEIAACAEDIDKYYERLEWWNAHRLVSRDRYDAASEYNHKKALWLCLMAINALEGVRFYASFACSWAFAERGLMEGNAKIIKLICRDENLHLAGVQHLLKILPKEDPDFAKIALETQNECVGIFEAVVEQESEWARFLFQHGSMIGLNSEMLIRFLRERAHKLMKKANLPTKFESGDSLPWTKRWIGGSDVQVAPQETELTSYIVGGIKQDVDETTFKGFTL